jgi:hypothetical protein
VCGIGKVVATELLELNPEDLLCEIETGESRMEIDEFADLAGVEVRGVTEMMDLRQS